MYACNTVEPVLQDHIMGHTTVASEEDRWALVTASITLKYSTQYLLPEIPGISRQVVFHGSGLSRQVSLYLYNLYYNIPS